MSNQLYFVSGNFVILLLFKLSVFIFKLLILFHSFEILDFTLDQETVFTKLDNGSFSDRLVSIRLLFISVFENHQEDNLFILEIFFAFIVQAHHHRVDILGFATLTSSIHLKNELEFFNHSNVVIISLSA